MHLVEATTADGVTLHGSLDGPGNEAVLLVHGTGSNFYSSSLAKGLGTRMIEAGYSVLSANTRGHDLVSTGRSSDGRWLFGAAYERVDECRLDLTAWIDLLVKHGHERPIVIGHSLGAIKAIYAQAFEPHSAVRGIAALSPPRLSHSTFAASPRGAAFVEEFERAQAEVAAGRANTLFEARWPLPQVVTAAAYVEKYGRDERFNLLKFVNRVTCPLFVSYGSAELSGMAFAGMPEEMDHLATRMPNLTTAVLAGADHLYTGAYDLLMGRLTKWFAAAKSV